MSKLRKLEYDQTIADLASVEAMLSRLTEEDFLARYSLEQRRDDLRRSLEEQASLEPETFASAALFFGGKPVVGGIGIDSGFGGEAVQLFQDIVSKQFAQDGGRLNERGMVPAKAASKLHITNIVRGSFGFLLEELDDQATVVDTSLKTSVDNVSKLISSFSSSDEEQFEAAAEGTGQRVIEATRSFFSLLRKEEATFRILIGKIDQSFDSNSIDRVCERASNTSVEESELEIEGILSGILPDGHQFEYRTDTARGLIRGRVDRQIPTSTLSSWLSEWREKPSVAVFTIKQVLKNGDVARESLTLKEIKHPPNSTRFTPA